jgi:hypothetical protein
MKLFESAAWKGTLPYIGQGYLSRPVVAASVCVCGCCGDTSPRWASRLPAPLPSVRRGTFTPAGAVLLSSDSTSTAMRSADTVGQSAGAAVAASAAALLESDILEIDDCCGDEEPGFSNAELHEVDVPIPQSHHDGRMVVR